jgi:subtilisin-like proprotein convertase family protein
MIKKRSARMALLACASIASLGLFAGASPAAAKVVTKTTTFNQCVNTALAIPDAEDITGVATAVTANVPVSVPKFKKKPQDGVVTALSSAGVRITHTDVGDLQVFLISPGGKLVNLSSFNDDSSNFSGDGYGSGAASCSGSLVTFADAFTTSITVPGNTGAGQPITGNFKPEQPLSTFVGGPARGSWGLVVLDEADVDIGSLNAVSLSLTYQYKALKKKKKKK